jgi:hypothetical protein
MIARIWKGVVRVDDADYIRETGFAEYAQTSGAAVLHPEDQRYLIGGESTETHYQVQWAMTPDP